MKNLILAVSAIAALTAPAFANDDDGEKVTPSVVTAISGGTVTGGDGVTPVTTLDVLPSDTATKESKE